MKKLIAVQPFEQVAIYKSNLFGYECWIIDQLDKDLSFSKEIARQEAGESFSDFTSRVKPLLKPSRWVLTYMDQSYDPVWPETVSRVGRGQGLPFQQLEKVIAMDKIPDVTNAEFWEG